MTLLVPPGTVVFVDDDAVVRAATVQSLELADLRVSAFDGAVAALPEIDHDFNGVIVSDIRMPDIDGLQFFRAVQQIDPTIPVILITGHGDVPMAVAAMQDGAHDFIPKPFSSGHLVASVQRALERRRLELDNRALRAMIADGATARSALIGETPAIVRLREAIEHVAGADVDVLIEGETGVGKELVATMIHRGSRRRGQPFVNIACGALSGEAAARQLFGSDGSIGQIAKANRGTLFLDEIERLDGPIQQRLLRVIEDREFAETGRAPTPVDLRIIAASREDLALVMAERRLREDLYYALNIVRLRIPPLRERRADIPLLFALFTDDAANQLRRRPAPVTDAARRHLLEHDWPGNVRELKSFAFQTAIGFRQPQDTAADLDGPSLPERVARFEASTIRAALSEARGNAAEALRRLGIPRKTFYDKLQRHNINIAAFRPGSDQGGRSG